MNIRKFVIATGIAMALGVSAFAQTLKIMPLGDSITWGYGGTQSGYRYFLYRDLVADGYGVDYIGNSQSEAASAAALPDHDHCGYSGWCITSKDVAEAGRGGILENIDGWMANLTDPDVVLLLLGTNDIASNGDLKDRPEALDQLISKIVANAPKAYVVVASVLERTDNATWDGYIQNNLNAAIPGIVATHAANGERVRFLDLRSKVTSATGLCSDGLHPNDAGYQQMADAWRAEIEAIFPLSEEGEGYQENVPFTEWCDYELVYEFTPSAKTPTYTKDYHDDFSDRGAPIRVAYYLELVKTGETVTNFVWASFDAITDNLANIGIPVAPYEAQCDLANMNVYCNVDGVATGEAIQTGNIEFWQTTFGNGNGRGGLGASDALFDWDDTITYGANFGSMQVHNHASGGEHTIFSYSAWCFSSDMFTGGLGIGSKPQERWSSDNPDPDWTFACNAETDYSYKKMQVFASFAADKSAPAIQSAMLSEDASTLVLRFTEKVDPTTVVAGNFTSDDYEIASVALAQDGRSVTITGELKGRPATVSITISGLADLAGNVAETVTSPAMNVIYKGYRMNVPEEEYGDYTLIYEFTPHASTPAYDIDNTKTVPSSFNRVAYYMEYQKTATSPVQFVWVSFDDISGSDTTKIGIPANGVVFQQTLANMNVYCNVDGVTTGTDIQTGNIEFWQYNYAAGGGIGLGGDDNAFDFDDGRAADGNHGSMQIHNYGEKQTLFSYSGFGSSCGAIGIGNRPQDERLNNDADWTFDTSGADTKYVYRKIQIFINQITDANPPTVESVAFNADDSTVHIRFNEPIAQASVSLGAFTLDGFSATEVSILDDNREVVLKGSPIDRTEEMTVSVSGIADLSGNEMEATERSFIAGYRGVEWNIPAEEREGYSLIYSFTPSAYMTPGYEVNNSRDYQAKPVRLAYYLEMQRDANTPVEYVWVSMPSFAEAIQQAGIPTDYMAQRLVSDMNVYCNVAGVPTGKGIMTGNVEFWPYSYNVGNSDIEGLEEADSTLYDFNDEVTTGGVFGSMQIHDYDAKVTLFSYSGFTYNIEAAGSIGIGNNPTLTMQNLDWTFAKNVDSILYKKIQIYATFADDSAIRTEKITGAIADGVHGIVTAASGTALTKSGSGDLVIGNIAGLASDNKGFEAPSVVVNAGRLVFANSEIEEGSIDDGAFMHLDASASETIAWEDGHIKGWLEVRSSGGHNAWSVAPYGQGQTDYYDCVAYPTILEGALNGMDTIDFGKYYYYDSSNPGVTTVSDDAAAMSFELCNLREGFLVVRVKDPGAQSFFLGAAGAYNWHRGDNGEIIRDNSYGWAWNQALWHVDGVEVDPLKFVMTTNDYHLLSFSFKEPVPVHTLTLDRICRCGGMEFAEIILFDRQINTERIQAIEAALLRKWFDRAHPAEGDVTLGSLNLSESASLESDRAVTVESLNAKGIVNKEGTGDLTANLYLDVSQVNIEGGCLSLAAPREDTTALNEVLERAYIHFDPSDADSLITAEDGTVTGMNDIRQNGKQALKTAQSGTNATIIENWSNGRSGLDFGDIWINGETGGASTETKCCGFAFNHTDAVRTAFVVVEKKTLRDCFILGDHAGDSYNFHADTGNTLLYNVHAAGEVQNGTWLFDGESVASPTTYPWVNDGVHVIAVRTTGNVKAGAIAQDRAAPCRVGGMRYGEVLIFEEALSDADFTRISNYLIDKWLDVMPSSSYFTSVTLGEGASFAHVGDLTLADGATLSLGYPFASAPITVDGTATLGKNITLTLTADTKIKGGTLPFISATSFTDDGNLVTWQVIGPDERRYRLVSDEGVISISCSSGTNIIIR